ncbi:NADPH-dependent F420 reductase [Pseudomonas sp. ML96]|jgi:hypothetical protein|uniref:NADPH-dependent F420 reductase n=1 Tax=Pseudomonas sp. ML96 TaxID=1523503 RepID=UPI0005B7A9D7|nr:NAD(P)-binding domain-containing protein [Pseudomonas sp. ML96]
MSIGIIGAGGIGSAIARLLVGAGLKVVISNRRGPESLKQLVDELGANARAVSTKEASEAEVVFLAVNWSKIPAAVEELGPWNGRIVIDTNNPIEAPLFKPFPLNGKPSTQLIADMLPGAKVVKAFNHLSPALLESPGSEGGKRVLFLSGEHVDAKRKVVEMINLLGFHGIDLGDLEQGQLAQFPGGPLPGLNLVKHG